jgi:8-oxo-dGTP pyrophosphatase MutT (NUDIX family)
MHIKIYFNDKPLFLCDEMNEEINSYAHHEDAVFIDEFSTPAVNSIIHEMREEKVHACIFLYKDFDLLKKAVWKKFEIVKAAGGLVLNEKKELLFIFRRGKWDLPKGKLDKGETLEECAVREVGEETGLKNISLKNELLTTYHTYDENGKHILKESYWYEMHVSGNQKLIPQTMEGIHEAKWVKRKNITDVLSNSFPSTKDVIKKYKEVSSE